MSAHQKTFLAVLHGWRWFTALVLCVSLTGFLGGCDKNKEKAAKHLNVLPGQDAQDLYLLGQGRLAKKKYEEAIEYFDAVKNNFPYSKQAAEAEFQTAAAYFSWKHYDQAAVAYGSFRKLHPSHEKAEYATMRQAESLYLDSPRTIDRDLTKCLRSLEVCEEFFRLYPDSADVAQVREISFKCRNLLAGQEFYIGRFYYRRGEYHASIGRLERVLKDHSGFGYDEKAAWYLGLSYKKNKENDKARQVFEKLAELFPEGKYGKKAKRKLKHV